MEARHAKKTINLHAPLDRSTGRNRVDILALRRRRQGGVHFDAWFGVSVSNDKLSHDNNIVIQQWDIEKNVGLAMVFLKSCDRLLYLSTSWNYCFMIIIILCLSKDSRRRILITYKSYNSATCDLNQLNGGCLGEALFDKYSYYSNCGRQYRSTNQMFVIEPASMNRPREGSREEKDTIPIHTIQPEIIIRASRVEVVRSESSIPK